MRKLSEKSAVKLLAGIRGEFAETIRNEFEHRAKSCETCETKGACCLDKHFVNVRITRLEASAINAEIDKLSVIKKAAVRERIESSIIKYALTDGVDKTFACPLFESGTGCLVHNSAKPLPCIAHACYEKKSDLPPEHLLREAEGRVFTVNQRTYSGNTFPLPLPVALEKGF
jgi:hypothetical protein